MRVVLGLALGFVALAGCHEAGARSAVPASSLVFSPGTAMVRTELYFGLGRAGLPDVTDVEFRAFLEEEVTPRFPDGLTVLAANGQWQDANKITREGARVVVIVHPAAADLNVRIDEIRAAYKSSFHQESVMQVDSPAKVDF